ncbi:MAG: HNH endonuclease signature motif containing protein [Betaproteobacteria bacterium]|jgi:hypothetical protein
MSPMKKLLEKPCRTCGRVLPRDAFHLAHKARGEIRRSHCKPCANARRSAQLKAKYVPVVRATLKERIEAGVVVDGAGCWRWQRAKNGDGYGIMTVYEGSPRKKKTIGVHRVAYREWVGPVPLGMVLDHLCRVRDCANPKHLEPVRPGENTLRGRSPIVLQRLEPTYACGHPKDAQHTYVNPKTGKRNCKPCQRAAKKRWSVKMKEARAS